MFKQVYDKSNGNPILIESNIEGDYSYDEFLYTEIEPPSELYEPRYFDGNEWVGNTKEEWENSQSNIPLEPSDIDILNAQLISNDIEYNKKIEALQQDIANLTSELLKMKGGMDNVSNS